MTQPFAPLLSRELKPTKTVWWDNLLCIIKQKIKKKKTSNNLNLHFHSINPLFALFWNTYSCMATMFLVWWPENWLAIQCFFYFLTFSGFLSLLLSTPPTADVLQPPTECYVIGMNAKSSVPHTKPRNVCLVKGWVDYSRLSELPKYSPNKANSHPRDSVHVKQMDELSLKKWQN